MDLREGFSAIPRHLFGHLTAYELAVLAAIHSRYPNAYPSHHLLAHDAGMSVSSVQRTLISLEEKNLVEVQSGQTEGRSNVYILSTAFFGGGRSERPRGRSERPTRSVRVTDEVEQRSKPRQVEKDGAPHQEEDAVKTFGQIEPDPEPPRKSSRTRVEPGTRAGAKQLFANEARYLNIRDYNRGHLSKVFAALVGDGYSWDEIEILIRVFFRKYEQDIRAKSSEYDVVRIFHQQINQGLKKQAADQIRSKRKGHDWKSVNNQGEEVKKMLMGTSE